VKLDKPPETSDRALCTIRYSGYLLVQLSNRNLPVSALLPLRRLSYNVCCVPDPIIFSKREVIRGLDTQSLSPPLGWRLRVELGYAQFFGLACRTIDTTDAKGQSPLPNIRRRQRSLGFTGRQPLTPPKPLANRLEILNLQRGLTATRLSPLPPMGYERRRTSLGP